MGGGPVGVSVWNESSVAQKQTFGGPGCTKRFGKYARRPCKPTAMRIGAVIGPLYVPRRCGA
jgi:hypothetical protein